MTAAVNLLDSAKRAQPWAKALEAGLRRHGRTPIFDALVEEFARAGEGS